MLSDQFLLRTRNVPPLNAVARLQWSSNLRIVVSYQSTGGLYADSEIMSVAITPTGATPAVEDEAALKEENYMPSSFPIWTGAITSIPSKSPLSRFFSAL